MTTARVKYSLLKKVGYLETDQEVIAGRNCIIDMKGDRHLGKVLEIVDREKVTIDQLVDNNFIRHSDEADEIHYDLQVRRGFYFRTKANEFITKNKVDCNIIAVEPTFDVKTIVFYFAAGQFLDYKNLIKELGRLVRAQISFHQVEGRERAKLVSDIGMCGLQTCCTRFLFDTPIISRKDVEGMWANERDYLGVCGRIKCCSTYEKRETGKIGCDSGGCSSGGCKSGSCHK